MKKVISICLAIFLVCNSILAQTAGKLDNKICNPDIRPVELVVISSTRNKQKLLLNNDHLKLPEGSREPGEKAPLHHHKWPLLNIQKAGSFIEYEEKANAICETRPLENSLQFPIKMYKGLKLHMNR